MNISKLNALIESKEISKAQIVKVTGISRPTLDAILNGGDFKVSNLEKIAMAVNKPVSYFFEEDVVLEQYNSFGDRGVVARHVGTVDQRSGGGEESADMAALRAENDKLKSELLEAQRTIINLMGKQK